jgi:hypothetical protein
MPMPVRDETPWQPFDRMFAASDDPWGFRTRWYEARKRELVLASLPRQRYATAYEPGCANGELAAALATRCDQVRASDAVAAAVGLARERVASLGNVEVVQAWMPQDWPAARFDLVVLGELGYYLAASALSRLIASARRSLAAEGTLLACHWRHPIDGCTLDGDAVHHALDAELDLARLVHHEERDFVIDVWSHDPRSVAQREGWAV